MMRVGVPQDEIEAFRQRALNEKWFPYVGVMPKGHWYRQWFPLVASYDPTPLWAKITRPVLLVDGELDKDVPVQISRARIEEALKRGGNKDYTVEVFPKADHSILVASEQGRPRLATGLLATVTDWLLERVDVKK